MTFSAPYASTSNILGEDNCGNTGSFRLCGCGRLVFIPTTWRQKSWRYCLDVVVNINLAVSPWV